MSKYRNKCDWCHGLEYRIAAQLFQAPSCLETAILHASRLQGLGIGLNIGASLITYTIFRVPYYNYSILGSTTLF